MTFLNFSLVIGPPGLYVNVTAGLKVEADAGLEIS